jgi:methylthioribose-1-phosphate isomerase
MVDALLPLPVEDRARAAYELSGEICDEDVDINFRIGGHGFDLIEKMWRDKKDRADGFQILTHCNAGWLATVDWGTALAPIYRAHDAGIPVHVWVDETRPHDLIVDNAGGHLMQHRMVDMCITGTDRTARNGDVCNKIGTYLKALAAHDNAVPFYVALPGPTIAWDMADGVEGIPIEERGAREVTTVDGRLASGEVGSVQITPDGVSARNFAFDVTPARLVSGLITERGICPASEQGLVSLYPDRGEPGDV